MPKLLNWSSLTFIATILGIAVPIWLWQADLNAKSLSFQLASQVPLTTETAGAIKGLEVLVDGVKIKSPTLSVVTLVNNGKKPLPAVDFEAPLELRVLDNSSIVRAEVTSTQPKDIEAKITWNKQALQFVPILLNPGETITISLLSEGERPTFSTRARVVGVSSVEFLDNTQKAPVWPRSVFFIVAAVLLFASSDIVDPYLQGGSAVIYVRKRAAWLLKIVCSLAGIACFIMFTEIADIHGLWVLAFTLIGTLILATVIGTTLNFGAKSAAKAE